MKSSKLLISESPLQVLPSLVRLLGLERAIIIQQIHFLTEYRGEIDENGVRWVAATYAELSDTCGGIWTKRAFSEHVRKLEIDEYLLSYETGRETGEPLKHYTVNQDKLFDPPTVERTPPPPSQRSTPPPVESTPPPPLERRINIEENSLGKREEEREEKAPSPPDKISEIESKLEAMRTVVERQTRAGLIPDSESKVTIAVGKLYGAGHTAESLIEFEKSKPYQKLAFYITDFTDWWIKKQETTPTTGPPDKPAREACEVCRESGIPGFVYEGEKAKRCPNCNAK